MKNKVLILMACFALIFFKSGFAQVAVTQNGSASALVQKLLGAGITTSNETITCDTISSGIFIRTNSNMILDSGIVLTSGRAATFGNLNGINGAASVGASSTTPSNYTDIDLANLIGTSTSQIKDACKLEFDFVPLGDTVKFRYIFGSDEYPTFNCSNFNDVFGFFISGPGITGNPNIALVPGTSIPVAINSVNSGANLGPLCTGMGTGSPFTQFYTNNTGGTTITYNGFTHVFTARAITQPCSTYHIKLAIADKGDQILDSGVFLEAGSLTSNGVSINSTGTQFLNTPFPYVVEGCMPVKVKFILAAPKTTPTPLLLQWGGTAINGVDYPTQPTSITIPANSTMDSIVFYPFQDNSLEGFETIKLKLFNLAACGSIPLDSAFYIISDSIIISAIPTDTVLCPGQSVTIQAITDTTNINFTWAPATWLASSTSTTTLASPLSTIQYQAIGNFGTCPPSKANVNINVINNLTANAGINDTTCLGVPFFLSGSAGPPPNTFTYSWSPGSNLNDSTLQTPIFTSTSTGNTSFVLTATADSTGCLIRDTLDILIIENTFNILTPDTAICKGNSANIQTAGSTLWSYNWTPTDFLNSTNTMSTTSVTPDTTIRYYLTGNYPGCMSVTKSVKIDVQPNPIVNIGPDIVLCDYDTFRFKPIVQPTWYQGYTYSWQNPSSFYNPNILNGLFKKFMNSQTVLFNVSTSAGCTGTDDAEITVNSSEFLNIHLVDTGICPPALLQYDLTGGDSYKWVPGLYLSDSTISNPEIKPLGPVRYTVFSVSDKGCLDSANINIQLHPNAVLELGEDQVFYDDDILKLSTQGNCSFFNWSPNIFLDNAQNSSPNVSGLNSTTTYVVAASTEKGCTTSDTITVIYNKGNILELPNVFLPQEGEFKIIKKGIFTLNYFRIFNRWGNLVFETNDFNKGWNGYYKDEMQDVGSYVYTIEVKDKNGKVITKNGSVLLMK